MKLYARLEYNIGFDSQDLFVVYRQDWGSNHGTYFASPLAFTKFDHTAGKPKPLIGEVPAEAIQDNLQFSSKDFMQAIVDEAWKQGIRPAGWEDHNNELKAVRFHLDDMRLLAKVKK